MAVPRATGGRPATFPPPIRISPSVGFLVAGDHPQHGGLAAAARPQQAAISAAGDAQIDAVHGGGAARHSA